MKIEIFKEDEFKKRMDGEVAAWKAEHLKQGMFRSFDGTKIHYVRAVHDAPRASIVLVHGFTEYAERYLEMLYYFYLTHRQILPDLPYKTGFNSISVNCKKYVNHALGKRTLNVLPFPGFDSSSIFALFRIQACLTMESPRPVPPVFLERLLSTR